MDLSSELKNSSLRVAMEAASAIDRGWEVSAFKEVSSAELLGVYSHRLVLLRSKPGTHAEQLSRSVAELVDGLRNAARTEIGEIKGDDKHRYWVFRNPHESSVIGVLRVVSQLDIDDEAWNQLWRNT